MNGEIIVDGFLTTGTVVALFMIAEMIKERRDYIKMENRKE